jgi:hypothetical protein
MVWQEGCGIRGWANVVDLRGGLKRWVSVARGLLYERDRERERYDGGY